MPINSRTKGIQIKPCLANFPILYPLKTTENHTFSSVFTGHKKATLTRSRSQIKGNKTRSIKKKKKMLPIRITKKTSHEEEEAEISFRQATF